MKTEPKNPRELSALRQPVLSKLGLMPSLETLLEAVGPDVSKKVRTEDQGPHGRKRKESPSRVSGPLVVDVPNDPFNASFRRLGRLLLEPKPARTGRGQARLDRRRKTMRAAIII